MFSCECFKISKTTYFEEHLHTAASEVTLGSDCLGISFGQLLSNQNFNHSSAHIPALNLTLRLSFEPRFRMFIINSYERKSKRL